MPAPNWVLRSGTGDPVPRPTPDGYPDDWAPDRNERPFPLAALGPRTITVGGQIYRLD